MVGSADEHVVAAEARDLKRDVGGRRVRDGADPGDVDRIAVGCVMSIRRPRAWRDAGPVVTPGLGGPHPRAGCPAVSQPRAVGRRQDAPNVEVPELSSAIASPRACREAIPGRHASDPTRAFISRDRQRQAGLTRTQTPAPSTLAGTEHPRITDPPAPAVDQKCPAYRTRTGTPGSPWAPTLRTIQLIALFDRRMQP